MIQPVVETVQQPVECLYTWYNRLYRVYKHPTGWQPAVSCKRGI